MNVQDNAAADADLAFLFSVAESSARSNRISRFFLYSFTPDARCAGSTGNCFDTALRDVGSTGSANVRPQYNRFRTKLP